MNPNDREPLSDDLGRAEALAMLAEVQDNDDITECPECGDGFEGVDMTLAGEFVFIHDEGDPQTFGLKDSCAVPPEEVPNVEF